MRKNLLLATAWLLLRQKQVLKLWRIFQKLLNKLQNLDIQKNLRLPDSGFEASLEHSSLVNPRLCDKSFCEI